MIGAGVGAGELFAAIRPIYGRNQEIGSVVTEDGTERIKLSSRQSGQRDIWAMQYDPFSVGEKEYKLAELAKVEKGQMPQEVAKENQQYRLCLQYEYIGASEQGHKLLKKDLEGIAYNVPGQALVTLTDGKKKLYEGELPVTQFGIIEYLAPVLFNKNSTIKVYFDPNTGGLLKVDREEGK